MYFDGLIRRLEAKGIGCFIGRRYCGVFGYADDLALVSPTIHGLKEMIKICEDYACEFDIMFNPKKSKLMCYNVLLDTKPIISSFFLYGKKLPYVVTRDVCPSVCPSVRLSVRLSVICGNIFGTRLQYN